MKKILLTLSLLFCFTFSNGWSETINDLIIRDGLYYKKFTDVPFTGKVTGKNQGKLKNGLKEGLWNYYHDNGQLHEKGNYKKNIKEGNWISYSETGELVYRGSFRNGKKIGDWIESRSFTDYGKYFLFKVYQTYNNLGRLHGPYKKICRNGNLSLVGTYENGKQDGKWVEYNCRDESIWEITNWNNGVLNGPYIRYDINGKVEGSLKNGNKHGKWVYYYKGSIVLKESGFFKNGKKISDLPIQ